MQLNRLTPWSKNRCAIKGRKFKLPTLVISTLLLVISVNLFAVTPDHNSVILELNPLLQDSELTRTSAIKPKGKPIELGLLIKSFMLDNDKNAPDWGMNANNKSITWITDGVDQKEYPSEMKIKSRREGLARIKVQGKVMTTLKRTSEEVLWNVVFDSLLPSDFPPESVSVLPDNNYCEFCYFDIIPSLNISHLSANLICQSRGYQY